MVENKNKIFER